MAVLIYKISGCCTGSKSKPENFLPQQAYNVGMFMKNNYLKRLFNT